MSKILFIEDDADLQKIYGEAFKRKGHEVIAVTDGNQGLFLAKKLKPNLILLDIMLPQGTNGFDVLEQLKKDEKLKKIPVIVLTNLETEKEIAMSIGVSDYLIKAHVTPNQVVERVGKTLRRLL